MIQHPHLVDRIRNAHGRNHLDEALPFRNRQVEKISLTNDYVKNIIMIYILHSKPQNGKVKIRFKKKKIVSKEKIKP